MSKYDKHIFICINKRAHDSDNKKSCGDIGLLIRNELKKQITGLNSKIKIRVNKSGCLNECQLGPALVVYPNGDWYTKVSVDDIPKIIDKSILN